MSDLTPREARMVYGLLKIREAQVKAALKRVQPFTDQDPGDRNAAKLGAAVLGRVVMTEPKAAAVIRDMAALIDHVKATAPTEIETREEVRPAYLTKLLAEVMETGELVPGVDIAAASSPYQRFEAADNAADLLAVVEPGDLPELDDIDLAAILGARPAVAPAPGAGGQHD